MYAAPINNIPTINSPTNPTLKTDGYLSEILNKVYLPIFNASNNPSSLKYP